MRTAEQDLLVGRSLDGRYRILERIARGGMSTVYAAVDERLDRLVAVKVMSAGLSSDPAFSDRFAREARAAARLTHLNAVSVYDQGHESGPDGHHVFLVMELVEGRTLRELLRERGRLATAEAMSIMEPVLSALSAAHRAGIVHRDVKPENILLSDDGVVKVADFGLARAVESDASSTRTGLMMGTVAYCAPEQIATGSGDQRADVYSAGVVFFELLTGAPPYSGESAMNVAYQHVHSRVPAPSSRVRPRGDIPSEVDELVIAATDSDPGGRPSDASAFLAELADIRVALALPVTSVPPRARAGRHPDQRPSARPGRRGATAAPGASDGSGPADAPYIATTAALRTRGGQHDTMLDPRRGTPANERLDHHAGDGPPPPVLIPPARARRRHGRRNTLIVVLVLLLVGAAAGYGAWYLASGRYSRIPALRAESTATAQQDLRDVGYRVRVQAGPVYDDKVAKGMVLRSDPAAGARIVRGRTVTLVLSAGPRTYRIPQVARMEVPQASSALLAVAPGGTLTLGSITQEYSATVPVGDVTRTVPGAGTLVRSGATIRIYASKGPPVVDVPSVAQGVSLQDAQRMLHKAKFHTATQQQYSDTVSAGSVISISPTSHAVEFSQITIVVSQGPETVQVPNVPPGESVSAATAAVKHAGLVPVVKVYGGTANGSGTTVIGADPQAGVVVHTGTTVTIYAI